MRLEKFERKGNEKGRKREGKGNEGIRVSHWQAIIIVVNCKKAIVAKIIHLLTGNKTIYTFQEENYIYKYVDL